MALRFVCYNVLADSYIKPSWYPAASQQWLKAQWRHPALVSSICAMNADVLALQEVEGALFKRLEERLTSLGYVGRYEAKGRSKPDGCALFLRQSSCTVTAWQRLDYQDVTGDEPVSGHLAQLARIVWQGRHLTLANTHLKWASEQVPLKQHRGARQLGQLVAIRQQCKTEGWLVCGDFNVTPESPVLDVLGKAGFRDAHAGARTPTCNANRQARKLDHIFINEALVATTEPIAAVEADTPLPSATQPSDHLPVVVELHWR